MRITTAAFAFFLFLSSCGENSRLRPVSTQEFDEQITSCTNAKESGELKTKKIKVIFEQSPECNWGQNGNLKVDKTVDGIIKARVEEIQQVDLQTSRKNLCNISVKSTPSQVLYDDEIALLFHKNYIFHSWEWTEALSHKKILNPDGHRVYQWLGTNGVRNTRLSYGTSELNVFGQNGFYCLSDVSCSIPDTEQTGIFNVVIPQESILKILIRNNPDPDDNVKLETELVTFGDNDPSDPNNPNDRGDCEHSPLEFNFEIEFTE